MKMNQGNCVSRQMTEKFYCVKRGKLYTKIYWVKRGFSAPDASWFKEIIDYVDTLLNKNADNYQFLNQKKFRNFYEHF